MDILTQAAQFILSLSLLIVLHELGHFIPAKLFKTKVEKFYLFFDPKFSLFKKKIGETVYGIGWLPLGGYVKIAGMVDESMDKEQMKGEVQPWEFRAKPAWQRLIIMVGGVTVNVILAIVIYAGMMMHYGEQYLPADELKYGVMVDSTAKSLGFQNGDKILSVDGRKPERFSEIPKELLLGDGGEVKIERNGEIRTISISDSAKGEVIDRRVRLVSPRLPYVAGSFTDSSVAQAAGMQKNDSIVALNGHKMLFFDQYLDSIPGYANEEVALTVYRDGTKKELTMTVPDHGKIGVSIAGIPLNRFYDIETRKYGFFEAFPKGLDKAVTTLTDYIRQFRLIFNSETQGYKHVGGFLTIADQYSTSWDWQRFWTFTAFLSIMLAFLNILPIPALDGGHVVFVLWEMISGKKPPEKVLEYAQMVGFIILLALLIFANGNDILKLFTGG